MRYSLLQVNAMLRGRRLSFRLLTCTGVFWGSHSVSMRFPLRDAINDTGMFFVISPKVS